MTLWTSLGAVSPSILQDRESESRFGATPVPGKIGMALAHGGGMGGHNAFGGPRALPPSSGAGNQLYVGNVRLRGYCATCMRIVWLKYSPVASVSSWMARPQRSFPIRWKHHSC